MQPTPEPAATNQSHAPASSPYHLRRTPSRLQRSSSRIWHATARTTTSNTTHYEITNTHSPVKLTPSCANGGSVAMEIDTAATASISAAVHVDVRMESKSMTIDGEADPKETTNTFNLNAVEDDGRMQVNNDQTEKIMTTPLTQTSMQLNRMSITHRLDQTTLRLCAQMLTPWGIIRFGRTCHALYATLNHPLTWKYAGAQAVNPSLHLSPTCLTPFLQHSPRIWLIRAADVTSTQIANALIRLRQLPYRLVGLRIDATTNCAKNEAVGELIQSLLEDVRMTNHLSRFVINSAEGQFFPRVPDALVLSILQLPRLESIKMQVLSCTIEMAQLLSKSQCQLLHIPSACFSDPSILPILAGASSCLINSLTKLKLPWMDFDSDLSFATNISSLFNLKIRTLTVDGSSKLTKLLVPLSCIQSLRHLRVWIDSSYYFHPSILIDLIREINSTVTQIDTLTIDVATPDPTTCSYDPVPFDHPLQECIEEYIRQSHAVSSAHRRSGPLIVRLA